MPRLIRGFAGCTLILLVLSCHGSYNIIQQTKLKSCTYGIMGRQEVWHENCSKYDIMDQAQSMASLWASQWACQVWHYGPGNKYDMITATSLTLWTRHQVWHHYGPHNEHVKYGIMDQATNMALWACNKYDKITATSLTLWTRQQVWHHGLCNKYGIIISGRSITLQARQQLWHYKPCKKYVIMG